MTRIALPNAPQVATTVVALTIGALGCRTVEESLPRWLYDAHTARERYDARLDAVGLTAAAVVRDWRAVGQDALHGAPLVSPPHLEEGYLPPAEPAAVAYRVSVKRGQALVFEIHTPGDSTTLWFLDAWEQGLDTFPPRPVADADSGLRVLTFRPRRDGEYILRAQPELLRGGRFSARVSVTPTLAFPVHGTDESAILSRFGAARDGGRREHQGIDIFAPRGTPALAAAVGTIVRVDTTRLGGNVVWLRDRWGNAIYYAHLDSQTVNRGTRVAIGDTVGFVGNTGNARTTPPHLHFGIYRRGEGPLDPFWFVHQGTGSHPVLVADTALLGAWARTRAAATALRTGPDDNADATMSLTRHTALTIVSAVGRWYRVRLPDGGTGYLATSAIESASDALAATRLDSLRPLLAVPRAAPAREEIRGEVARGDSVEVLGQFGAYQLVRLASGEGGWLAR